MTLLKLFDDVDMGDAAAVSNAVSSLVFASNEQQAEALQSLRDDLQFTVPGMARAMGVNQRSMERFLSGHAGMKQVHVKLLALMLMLRVTEPELFLELFSAGSGDKRFK